MVITMTSSHFLSLPEPDLAEPGLAESALLELINNRISPTMRENLEREFTRLEVKEALFQMHPAKSPGPDGMSALFYQKYWHVVGERVTKVALDFLNHEREMPEMNHTNTVLIPKVRSPVTMKDYRPISLCNVVYKIISKVMANKMKHYLLDMIDGNQSAFVPDKQILNNALVAFEIIHHLKNRRRDRGYQMALKFVMSKAYDRVNWDYLERVLGRIGFSDRWVRLMMTCVRTVTYSVVFNGKQCGRFASARGHR